MKKKLILADSDEMYLTNLSNFFMEKAPQFELNLFTRADKLYEYLKTGAKADILAVSEDMAGAELLELADGMAAIVLSATMNPVEGYGLVRKYQKTQALLNEILLLYAESSNSVEAIRGQSNTRIAAFYSPAGGTGKTTLALALATAAAWEGKKVFYLNLEEIDSVSEVLGTTPGTLSDIFLALKTKGMNVGLKLAGCTGTEQQAGFSYLSGTESISEFDEIGAEDMRKLVTALRGLSEYDLAVVDLASGFSAKTQAVLEEMDVIFVPMLPEEGAVSKMKRLVKEQEIHEQYAPILSKMRMVMNRSGVTEMARAIQGSGLADQIPCCGAVAQFPVLARYSDILRSGGALGQVMAPLLRETEQEQDGGMPV
ncbi:MAG: AAA family ATPase [Eubacteriales bacterium]|nr:AAA family ATPase [Eubacteriales bacterium]